MMVLRLEVFQISIIHGLLFHLLEKKGNMILIGQTQAEMDL